MWVTKLFASTIICAHAHKLSFQTLASSLVLTSPVMHEKRQPSPVPGPDGAEGPLLSWGLPFTFLFFHSCIFSPLVRSVGCVDNALPCHWYSEIEAAGNKMPRKTMQLLDDRGPRTHVGPAVAWCGNATVPCISEAGRVFSLLPPTADSLFKFSPM